MASSPALADRGQKEFFNCVRPVVAAAVAGSGAGVIEGVVLAIAGWESLEVSPFANY